MRTRQQGHHGLGPGVEELDFHPISTNGAGHIHHDALRSHMEAQT